MSIFANKKDLDLLQSKCDSLSAELAEANESLLALKDIEATKSQEIGDLQNQISALTESLSAEKTQLDEKALEVETLTAKIAEVEQSTNEKAMQLLSQSGVPPIEIEEQADGNSKTREEFNSMDHLQRSSFVRNGGKIK